MSRTSELVSETEETPLGIDIGAVISSVWAGVETRRTWQDHRSSKPALPKNAPRCTEIFHAPEGFTGPSFCGFHRNGYNTSGLMH